MPMIDTNLYAVTSTDDYVIGPTNFVISGRNAKYIAWSEIRGVSSVQNACLAIRLGWTSSDTAIRIVGGIEHLDRIAKVANTYREAGMTAVRAMTSPDPIEAAFETIDEEIAVYRSMWMD